MFCTVNVFLSSKKVDRIGVPLKVHYVEFNHLSGPLLPSRSQHVLGCVLMFSKLVSQRHLCHPSSESFQIHAIFGKDAKESIESTPQRFVHSGLL